MKNKQMIIWTLLVLMTLISWGCGSSRDSSGTVVDDADEVLANAEVQGISNCATCHAFYQQTADWLASTAHGNSNDSPDFNYFGQPPADCEGCHNANDDGDQIADSFAVVSGGTEIDRPVVSCESCHGGGQFHSGVGPIPYVRPGPLQCVSCHDGGAHAPAVATKVAESRHNAEDLHASRARCQRCHSYEGSLAFSAYTGNKTTMNAANDETNLVEEELNPPDCAACHVPHDESIFRGDTFIALNAASGGGNWDPNASGGPDQFDFCTSCHVYQMNNDGNIVASGEQLTGGAATDEFYHDSSWYRVIASTHYDNPATGFQGATSNVLIEGYVIRKDSANPCFDCHGHELRADTGNLDRNADGQYELDPNHQETVHNQWAKSAHAGALLTVKYDAQEAFPKKADGSYDKSTQMTTAIMNAGTDDTTDPGSAWTHYDWDSTIAWDGTALDNDRGECQMCHTSTGASNFLVSGDATVYDLTGASNDFSHLEGWSLAGGANGETISSNQNELLYCWGCHDSVNDGTLNNPEVGITFAYTKDSVNVQLPDLGDTNVCVNCHGGRGNMDSFIANAAADPTTANTNAAGFGPGTQNATNTHYYNVAATIYQEQSRVGYEYRDPAAGTFLDYANPGFYAHNEIGLNMDSPETGKGSCVTCHMYGADHNYAVVETDASGAIIAINSQENCNVCHTGQYAISAAIVQEEAEGYHQALETTEKALSDIGIVFQSNYPYFSTATTADGTWINEGNFGAAHNFNYLHHEPGAYAHNRYYAKRLLFDSMDWVDGDNWDTTVDPAVRGTDGNPLDGIINLDDRDLDGDMTIDDLNHVRDWYGATLDTSIVPIEYIATRP